MILWWMFDTRATRAASSNASRPTPRSAADSAARVNRVLWEGGFFSRRADRRHGGAHARDSPRRRAAPRQQNFLARVSHEFKSPLASIQLAAKRSAALDEATASGRPAHARGRRAPLAQ